MEKMTDKADIKVAAANKILTVVIPTYNMEKYLHRCLDSLIVSDEQMNMLEVLVINDGSKDNSSKIGHEYQDRYPQTFRVIDKENGNYGSCVNRGLDEATGKYFRLLDADDQFNKDSFPQFLSSLETADADMVLTHHCYSNEGDDSISKYNERPKKLNYGQIYKAQDFDFEDLGCEALMRMHSITYKLDILRKVGLRHQTGISYTDTEYDYFPLVGVKSILPLDLYLYIYTLGREGQTVSYSAKIKSINSYYKVARRIFDDYIACVENKKDKSLSRKQMLIMSKIFIGYYNTNLCVTKKNDDEEKRMRNFYEEIKEKSPELLNILRHEKIRKILYYFKIWEATGKYITDQPFKLIYDILTFIKGEKIK